jgi:hypothetical protein
VQCPGSGRYYANPRLDLPLAPIYTFSVLNVNTHDAPDLATYGAQWLLALSQRSRMWKYVILTALACTTLVIGSVEYKQTQRFTVRLNNSAGVGLRILPTLFIKEVLPSSVAWGQIERGDKIVGSSFQAVIAILKRVTETQHVEIEVPTVMMLLRIQTLTVCLCVSLCMCTFALQVLRAGNVVGPEIQQHIADSFQLPIEIPPCTVSYDVSDTGLINQHMAHLSAIEFAWLSSCMLRVATPSSRDSFNTPFKNTTFNRIPFASLYDLPYLQRTLQQQAGVAVSNPIIQFVFGRNR